jgi:hypothetical protein
MPGRELVAFLPSRNGHAPPEFVEEILQENEVIL